MRKLQGEVDCPGSYWLGTKAGSEIKPPGNQDIEMLKGSLCLYSSDLSTVSFISPKQITLMVTWQVNCITAENSGTKM